MKYHLTTIRVMKSVYMACLIDVGGKTNPMAHISPRGGTNSEGCGGGGDKKRHGRWLRRLELEYTRGKTVRSGGHKSCATSDRHSNRSHRSDEGHAHMAIAMTTRMMKTSHQVNKVTQSNVRKRCMKKKNEKDKGCF